MNTDTMNKLNIDTTNRCGRLVLVGHYSNQQHRLEVCNWRVPAKYRGTVADAAGSTWHKFFVPAIKLDVYARVAHQAAAAYAEAGAVDALN